ncbi:hypothetical protein BD779DRAFT_978124 [Infundibulicybe gibba]|nr:hypothetical protein BD779DRAFT_978124 [Infundibulicybe gibba]
MVSAHHQHVVRKVPRPPQPTPVNFVAGVPARILVPNSDTSVAASQSQSKSQPKDSSQAIYIAQSGDRLNAFPPDNGSKSPSVSHLDDEETNYDGDRSSPFNDNHSAPDVAMSIVSPLDGDCVLETSDVKPAQTISIPNDQRKGSRLKDVVVQEPSGLQLGVLEGDDVQTHVLLSGSAVPPAHAVPGENEPEPPASPVHENGLLGGTQGVRVSRLATPANLGNKVQEPVNKAHGSSPGTVEHDPIAWAAPTFSREPNATEFPSRSASKQSKAKVAHSTSREQTNTWGRE